MAYLRSKGWVFADCPAPNMPPTYNTSDIASIRQWRCVLCFGTATETCPDGRPFISLPLRLPFMTTGRIHSHFGITSQ